MNLINKIQEYMQSTNTELCKHEFLTCTASLHFLWTNSGASYLLGYKNFKFEDNRGKIAFKKLK